MGIIPIISNFFHRKSKDDIIFLHYLNTNNIGDLYCCPKNYFSYFKDAQELDILDYDIGNVKNKILIIGGGGLLQEPFVPAIKNILNSRKDNKIIIWGVGLDNSPTGKRVDSEILKDAHLIGVRDINTPYIYVPCVSCMSKLFDKYREKKTKTKIRCYVHSLYDFPEFLSGSFETYENSQNGNDNNAMEKAIAFLSGAECILTNSFHGVYWATLLNRKVIALPFSRDGYTKFSDKFLTVKYKPVYISDFNEVEYVLKDKLKKAKNYDEALFDSRKINIEFFEAVKNLI